MKVELIKESAINEMLYKRNISGLHKGDVGVVVVCHHYKDDAVNVWYHAIDEETDDCLVIYPSYGGKLFFSKTNGQISEEEQLEYRQNWGIFEGKTYELMTPEEFISGLSRIKDSLMWEGCRVMTFSNVGGGKAFKDMCTRFNV